MALNKTTYHPQYITCTILECKKLLKPQKYKHIITESLSFLTIQNHVIIYAFVVINNHIHLKWQMRNAEEKHNVQGSLLRFSANIALRLFFYFG
jgi:REP element-mobilizing transposase RayT